MGGLGKLGWAVGGVIVAIVGCAFSLSLLQATAGVPIGETFGDSIVTVLKILAVLGLVYGLIRFANREKERSSLRELEEAARARRMRDVSDRMGAEQAEKERQGEAQRIGEAVASALVQRGATVATRCTRCGQLWQPDSRGGCSACGAPPGAMGA